MEPVEGPDAIQLVWRDLAPGGPGFYAPRDPDALLDVMDDVSFRATDERMPYFAEVWPSGLALASAVLAGPALQGLRVLDLGCGVGTAGIAAAHRGGDVTFLDWEPRALEIVRRSARAQGLDASYVAADWRTAEGLGDYDRVLAADVLYEERNLPAVVPFLVRHVAPGGEAWVADPGRRHAGGLLEAAARAGLRLLEDRPLPAPSPGASVRLFRFAGYRVAP
jgi:predicted nicotinamide N-methyase